ncbi:hypothetical protein ACUSIJ_24730 [Pseudochelatococcus sp. B33]
MTKAPAPDRIWAVIRGGGVSLPGYASFVNGYFEDIRHERATEYVRADIVAEMERELNLLRNIVQGVTGNDN